MFFTAISVESTKGVFQKEVLGARLGVFNAGRRGTTSPRGGRRRDRRHAPRSRDTLPEGGSCAVSSCPPLSTFDPASLMHICLKGRGREQNCSRGRP